VELAKVTSKGQITLPIAIRELLELNEGDKVVFFKKNNDIVIRNTNTAMNALADVQKAFDGEADRLGLKTEEDIVNMVKEFRKEKKKKQ